MIRILLLEDRPEIRLGLQMRLDAEADIAVIGSASDRLTAFRMVDELVPDVVLMDLEKPVEDGLETSYLLHLQHPLIPVVVVTMQDDAYTRSGAACAQVAGFVSKDKPDCSLIETIRRVAPIGASSQRTL